MNIRTYEIINMIKSKKCMIREWKSKMNVSFKIDRLIPGSSNLGQNNRINENYRYVYSSNL